MPQNKTKQSKQGKAEREAERLRQVAESNRKTGKVLSIIGGVLTAIVVVMPLVAGLIRGNSHPETLRGSATSLVYAVGMSAAPGILALFALCFVMIGEQLRRGGIGRNARRPTHTVLPQASMVSRFTILGTGWHVLWALVTTLVAAVFVGIPVASWFTGEWPANAPAGDDFSGWWIIYGSLAAGIAAALWLSLVKKLIALRHQARERELPAAGRGFWRWILFRWRFDVWLGGLGGFAIALSTTFLQSDDTTSFVFGAGAGVVLWIVGALLASQFWRSGEQLGTGESFV